MGSLCGKCCRSNCMRLVQCPPCCHCGLRCQICCEFCQCANCCEEEDEEEELVQYISAFDVRNTAGRQAQDAQGSFVYPNGDKYLGEWQAGKRHGYGEFIGADGTRLKGYFFEDKFMGEHARPPSDTLTSDTTDPAQFDSARLVIRKATVERSEEDKAADKSTVA